MAAAAYRSISVPGCSAISRNARAAACAQAQVRPREHDPDRGGGVLNGVEQVKLALPVGEFGDELSQRAGGAHGGEFRRDPQGQRQPGAQCG